MNIPSEGPGFMKTGTNFLGKKLSRLSGYAGMGAVIASPSDIEARDKTLTGLCIPYNVVTKMNEIIWSIKDQLVYIFNVAPKGEDITIRDMRTGHELFHEPIGDLLLNGYNNFNIEHLPDLFSDDILKAIAQNQEGWQNLVETLLALFSVGGVYIILIPAILKLILYKDCPDIGQRLRSKMYSSGTE